MNPALGRKWGLRIIPGEKDLEKAKKREEEEWGREFDKFKEKFQELPEDVKKQHAEAFEKALEKAAMKWPTGGIACAGAAAVVIIQLIWSTRQPRAK